MQVSRQPGRQPAGACTGEAGQSDREAKQRPTEAILALAIRPSTTTGEGMGASRTPEELADRAWIQQIASAAADATPPHRTQTLWRREHRRAALFQNWCKACGWLGEEDVDKEALEREAIAHQERRMTPVQNGIRGISDRRRIPRLGKIHLGVRVQNSSGRGDHPQATDYFVVPKELEATVGEKPTKLNIAFHSDEPAEFAGQNFRRYGSGTGLTCRGDGNYASALVQVPIYQQWQEQVNDPDALPPPELWARGGPPAQGQRAPEWREIRCYGPGYEDFPPCPAFAARLCNPVMQLQFVLLDSPGFGIWQIDTQSVMSIERVNSFVDFLRATTGGRIAGIPLTLSLEKTSVAPEGRRKDVHVLRLDFPGTFRQALDYAQRPAGLVGLLPPPQAAEDEPEDEQPLDVEVIEGEVIPPTTEAAPRRSLLDEALAHGAVSVERGDTPVVAGSTPAGAAPIPFLEEYPERRNNVPKPPDVLGNSGHFMQWARYYFGWDRAETFKRAGVENLAALEFLCDENDRNWNRVAELVFEREMQVEVES